jgi:hypothetical protein
LIKAVVVKPALLKLINSVGGNPAPSTTSGGLVRLKIFAASLPEKPGVVKIPVRPDPEISALLGVVAGGSVQVMQLTVPGQPLNPGWLTVRLPEMSNVPINIGDADIVAANSTASIAPSTKLLILLPRIA